MVRSQNRNPWMVVVRHQAVVLFLFMLVALSLSAQTDSLKIATNYFVTGDYVVGGVGLRGMGVNGFATGTINIPDQVQPNAKSVPEGADIVEAFLYWQTVESSQSAFAGQLGYFNGYPIQGVVLGNPNAPVSWSSGGCSGSSSGSKTIRMYRAGVRPYLKYNSQGMVQANGSYTVKLADSGSSGNGAPMTLGATLVIIYRVMSPSVPLSAVVLYDGAYAPSNASLTMTQNIYGFYQPSQSPIASITHIVGNGQDNKGETVYLNNNVLPSLYPNLPPFPGKYAGAWDNPTWDVSTLLNVPPNEAVATASVVPVANSAGCVSWGAIILKTTVKDSDNDGLLDVWEANQGYTSVKDNAWVPLPGANPNQKDIFTQLDYLCSIVNADGSCDTVNGHSHLPPQQARDMVTSAFAGRGISLHLGVGSAIQETTCTDDLSTNPPKLCPYPNQPGVVTWRAGYNFLKTQPLNYPDEATCEANADCVRRFQYGKKDSYHYILAGHSAGVADWSFQTKSLTNVVVTGSAAPYTATFTTPMAHGLTTGKRVSVQDAISVPGMNGTFFIQSATTNTFSIQIPYGPVGTYTVDTDPNISISDEMAGTASGMSDVGGQDSFMSLGGWGLDGQSVQVQAGTLMHELGHSLTLTHGGFYFDNPNSFVPTVEPNCKPNFQSIMNYLFQVDLLGPDQVLDYSGQQLDVLNEGTLSSVPGVTFLGGTPAFSTTKWYATTAQYGVGSPANRHCNGSALDSNDIPMYRWEGDTSPIAWQNGWDINYDGVLSTGSNSTTEMRGQNDWGTLDLRQMGATGTTTVEGGVLYAGSGGVLYAGSGGVLYAGSGGVLYGGSGGVLYAGSGGVLYAGSGGVLYGGSGGVLYAGSGGVGHGDLTYETASSVVRPPKLLSVVIDTTGTQDALKLTWQGPSFGQITSYNIYRGVNGATPTLYTSVTGSPVPLTYSDTNVACGPLYTYFVTALVADGRESSPSNSLSAKACTASPYKLTGFYSPLATAGDTSYSGSFNISKSVTAKWTLQDSNGNYLGRLNANTLYAVGPIPAVNGACPLPKQVPNVWAFPPYPVTTLYSPTSGAKGGSTFRISSSNNQFIFNWDTKSTTTGCYILELDLDSGQVFKTALKLQ